MFVESGTQLSHMDERPPVGSPAYGELERLADDGFSIELNPYTKSGLAQEFIARDFSSEPKENVEAYLGWRRMYPGLQLFLLQNCALKLAAAAWVLPVPETAVTPRVAVEAQSALRLFDPLLERSSAARFVQVANAYTYERFTFAGRGIMSSITNMQLLPILNRAGYTLRAHGKHPTSGIARMDMVVSSESLAALNEVKRRTAPPKAPASATYRPKLTVIQGGKTTTGD